MRSRSRSSLPDLIVPGYYHNDLYTYTSGQQYITTTDFTQLKAREPGVWTEEMNDELTPNFHERMASGDIITNDMSSLKITDNDAQPTEYLSATLWSSGDGTAGEKWYGMLSPQYYLGNWLTIDDHEELRLNLEAQAVTRAYENMNNTEWAVAMVAAEGRKTLASISDILLRVIKIVRAIKRLDAKYLRKQISQQELEKRYMELRYALRPLMYDVRDAQKAYNKKLSDVPKRYTFRGYASESVSNSSSEVATVGSMINFDLNRTSSCKIDVRAGILCNIKATKLNILGVDQILETIWEITPYSFIIDWFIDVGGWIASWTPNAGVEELTSWTTTFRLKEYSNTMDNVERVRPNSYDVDDSVTWSGTKSRSELTKIRTADPQRSYLPHFNVNLDSFKILDLLIILKGLMK